MNIGVIGCGAIGREHIKRLTHRIIGSRVTAVMDVSEKNAKLGAELAGGAAAVYQDAHAVVSDPNVDALVVTTPGFAHKEAVLAAIAAGKPVFTEKPLCTTAADAREVVDAEIASGRHLVQVGFMRRYDRGYQQMKTLLDGGSFGEPLVLKCTHRAISVDPSYTTDMAVTDTAIHEIDVLHWLLKDDWAKVQVITGKTTRHAAKGLIDPQIMLLQTKGGVTVVLEVYVNCRFGYDINCEVVCEEGTVSLPAPAYPTVKKDCMVSTPIEQSWINRFIDSYDTELQDWVTNAAKGEVHGPNAWDGYMAEVTADALVKAQSSGQQEAVSFGETPDFYRI